MASPVAKRTRGLKLLVINPNSSTVMTEGLDKMIVELGYHENTEVSTYTAPHGPASINNEVDAAASTEVVLAAFKEGQIFDTNGDIGSYNGPDGILVACYSVHPLTLQIQSILPKRVPVIGIFEASVSTALSLLRPPFGLDPRDGTKGLQFQKFGIVTTGKYWEGALTEGVLNAMGVNDVTGCERFKGVFSTGLSAGELHTAQPDEVRRRMKDATKLLVKDRDVLVICLGCAGMAGMDAMVREACVEELGEEAAQGIWIVDGVKAGIAILDGLVRSRSA